jgi:class 3 adenylate cyclase
VDEQRQRSIGESFAAAITRQVHEDLLAELAEERGSRGKRRKERGGRAKPEGIVTIVFTDIVDSSRLVSEMGDAAARELIRAHDEMLRETAREHEGVEVERAGDGFMIAFSTATKALAFAVGLQERISRESPAGTAGGQLRIRIGMETGEVIAEEQGYFGRTVFAASRITDLAGGGQIMASEATRLIGVGSGVEFRDLGERELKGLGAPYRIHEVVWSSDSGLQPDLPSDSKPDLPPGD